jgi:hypothetical protein
MALVDFAQKMSFSGDGRINGLNLTLNTFHPSVWPTRATLVMLLAREYDARTALASDVAFNQDHRGGFTSINSGRNQRRPLFMSLSDGRWSV